MKLYFGFLLLGLSMLAGCCYFCKKECHECCKHGGKPQEQKDMQMFEKAKNTMFVFMGAPGSGKGTIATDCVKKFGFKVLSTGNALRERIATGDELGKKVQEFTSKGALVPSDLVLEVVNGWLKTNGQDGSPIVLDGFPRTADQVESLMEILKKDLPAYKVRVISIEIPDEEIIKRLSERYICENKKCQATTAKSLLKDPSKLVCPQCGSNLTQREDDKEAVVRDRLKVYAEHADAMEDAFEKAGIKIEELNVLGLKVEQVFDAFKAMI